MDFLWYVYLVPKISLHLSVTSGIKCNELNIIMICTQWFCFLEELQQLGTLVLT
jgi:hypothetical protein